MSHNNLTPIDRTSAPIKVAVLSDDSLLQTALASMLAQQSGVEVTALAGADVALWDPGAQLDRLESKLGELAGIGAPTLALLPDASRAQRVLGAGARGVMMRDAVGPHIVSALRAVQGGLTVLDTSLADGLIGPAGGARPDFIEDLTARESEVVQQMAEGLSNKDIAKQLSISEHTAKFHIGRILAKLDADTRTEAVVRALRYGLVEL